MCKGRWACSAESCFAVGLVEVHISAITKSVVDDSSTSSLLKGDGLDKNRGRE